MMPMFLATLKLQWRVSRAVVGIFTVLAFTAPLMAVYLRPPAGEAVVADYVSGWLHASQAVGQLVPMIALFFGVFLGMTSWSMDHLGRHVYALSLPVQRSMLVSLRFLTGVALTTLPVIGLGAGSLLATSMVQLPEGVHAYPVQLTVRFGLTVLVCFAIFFAISIATRRAILLTLGSMAAIALADVGVNSLLGRNLRLTELTIHFLTTWPGPLSLLVGRWGLFDV